MIILSIDIGGTTTKIGLIDSNGNLIKKFKPIKSQKGHSLKWLFEYINNDIKDDYDVIGIDVPGFYSPKDKILVSSGNLEYNNFKIWDEAKKYTSKDVYFLNDANAAALGEYWKIFSKSNVKNVLFYILGTGVGGGIIINGKLYEGSNGFAGEFGHGFLIDETKCACGLKGCIEPLSSAIGITKKINEYATNPKNKQLHNLYKKGEIELPQISSLIENDEATISAIEESLIPIVKHISTLCYSLDPQAIIIGGGPSNLGEPFINIFKRLIEKNVSKFIYEKLKIEKAILGNDASLYGNVFNIISNTNTQK